jgi:serine-type D-Ala-D-Ala carboxypeptidase/endopeptidase
MKSVWVALCLSLAANGAAAEAPLLPTRIAQAAQQRIDAGELPVLVIGVVDGERSAVYVYGKLDNGRQPDGDTAFEIGSITKTFTATLLAQQVTEGKLQLDTPVATLLPGFTIPTRNGKAITLGNLANQHSGLPRLPGNFAPADPKDPYADYDAGKLKAFLASYALTRDPGSQYEYSNLGEGLLGYALSVHAGTSYPQLLQRQIFKPLGMDHTSATQDEANRAHLALGHDAAGKQVANWHFDALAGCGAIVSTANDMLRYLKANMGAQKSPLYPSMQFAQTPRVDVPGAAERVGLAWMTRHDDGGDVIWHNGQTGGYASYLGFTADRQHGVVILTNISIAIDNLGLATLLPKVALDPVHKRIAMSEQQLDEYVGSYQLRPGFVITMFRTGDQLMSQATGQGAFPLFPSDKDEFFANVGEISLSFKRDGRGKINGLVLHQHGDHPAPRVDAATAAANAPTAVTLDAATLGSYVGHYQLAPNAVLAITVNDGKTFAQLTGQPMVPIYASARDKFFLRVVDAQIDFERDAQGKVVALVLHQNGLNQRAPRTAE